MSRYRFDFGTQETLEVIENEAIKQDFTSGFLIGVLLGGGLSCTLAAGLP